MTEPFDDRLRASGARYRQAAKAVVPDLGRVTEGSQRQRRTRRVAMVTAALIALAVVPLAVRGPRDGVVTWGGVPTAPGSGPPDIRAVDFTDHSFPADTCQPGAVAPAPPERDAPGPAGTGQTDDVTVAVSGAPVYGDLTGDAIDEAVVTITCSSAAFHSAVAVPWVFTPDAGAAAGIRRLPFTFPVGGPDRLAEWRRVDAPAAEPGTPGYVFVPPARIVGRQLLLDWQVSAPAGRPADRFSSAHTWTGAEWDAQARSTR